MPRRINRESLAQSLVDQMDMRKKDAVNVIDLLFDEMSEALADDGVVDISGFGKFSLFFRKSRMGINPITKERMEIRATQVPKFKPSQTLKNRCNK